MKHGKKGVPNAKSTAFGLCLLLIVIVAVFAAVVAFAAGIAHRKKIAEAVIGSAEEESKRIVNDAIKTSEAKKKEIILEGKDEVHRLRNESERELNERRKEGSASGTAHQPEGRNAR